jgi:hypothetical protein
VRLALVCLCAVVILAACGKKGNPLPPLVRIPAAPGGFAVTRIADRVFVRFTTPTSNVDGVTPADVARVELYAITLAEPPRAVTNIDPEDLRAAATLVASERVRRPPQPPPPVKEGLPPIPLPPPEPGVEQGAPVVLAETLSIDLHTPAMLPQDRRDSGSAAAGEDVPRALVAPPAGSGVQRYYFAAAVSPRGRYSPHTALVPAPLAAPSGPPSRPIVSVTEDSLTLRWSPPVNARGIAEPGNPDWLPSRPLVPGPPATTYDVYEVPRDQEDAVPIAFPTPLTAEPVGATEFTQQGITLGRERCFVVRAVDVIDGVHVRGPASPMECSSFADTFAPAAPSELVAVAVAGGVNLIWEPSDAADVAGYLVLRGDAGSATLTPLMKDPVTTPSYRDEAITPGLRYVYAVVAVDRAGNRSSESNRVEETAQ